MDFDRLRSMSTEEFIDQLRELARTRFDCKNYPQHGLPREDWAALVRAGIFLPALPREYGGRDSHAEMVRVVECLAEWNLPLAMYTKIVTAVGIRPIALHGSEKTKAEVLGDCAAGKPVIIGFASTEPACGSVMSSMTTTFEEVEGGYRIRGMKHWQGLSCTADWWIVNSKSDENGRRYGYFVIKRSEGWRTVERYEPIGMKALDYGLNEIDAVIPRHRRMAGSETDLSGMIEMLGPPRSMMGALSAGFLKRIEREAKTYAANRQMGYRGVLSDIGFVKYRLKAIEASRVICDALRLHLETALDLKDSMLPSLPSALSIKTVATERMIRSAHDYQQIIGGEGYRVDSPTNVAAKAFLDTRVFTIFDGTNDLLSELLTDHFHRARGAQPLSAFLAGHPLTARAVGEYGLDLSFLDIEMRQEHLVLAGRAIAYVVALSCLATWMEKMSDKVSSAEGAGAVEFLKTDIRGVAGEFELLDLAVVV